MLFHDGEIKEKRRRSGGLFFNQIVMKTKSWWSEMYCITLPMTFTVRKLRLLYNVGKLLGFNFLLSPQYNQDEWSFACGTHVTMKII